MVDDAEETASAKPAS